MSVRLYSMLWFLKDRSLDVAEAALQIRRYNAWRVENGYDNVSFESVESEFNTGKALLLDQRDLLGRWGLADIARHVKDIFFSNVRRAPRRFTW